MAFQADATKGRSGACLAIVWALAAAAGCAHKPSAANVSVDELNRKLQSLRTENAAYARQVEELENRVFILSGQLETRKEPAPSGESAPALPKVTLHKAEAVSGAGPESGPAEEEIEYGGEAAKRSPKRPVLRLHGDETPVLLPREREPVREEPKTIAVVGEAQTPPAPSPRPHPATSARAVEAFELYRRGYAALREGRHDEAAESLRAFLRQHGGHELADNAQYWVAECYYDRKDFVTAIREFRRVVERYAGGNKVPDALLKIGYSYLSLGSEQAGRDTLLQLVRTYPRHPAATLAGVRIAELGKGAGLHARAAGPSKEVR